MSKPTTSPKQFDLRTLDYKLNKGEITQQEYDNYLNNLPDEEGNYDLIEIEEPIDEDDFEDEDEDEDEEEDGEDEEE